ncbi:MAG: alpha/beta fold hydrolase, partial [Acidimicrobiales bacterium]
PGGRRGGAGGRRGATEQVQYRCDLLALWPSWPPPTPNGSTVGPPSGPDAASRPRWSAPDSGATNLGRATVPAMEQGCWRPGPRGWGEHPMRPPGHDGIMAPMATIEVDGTTLYYEATGKGPALLFIHGMCGDADVWADQARRFDDRHTCVRYDRRGHSRSEWGEHPISPARHADDAASLIEALGLAPCLLVGSSGGAVVAFEVARRHRHLLRGTVLSEPPLFGVEPGAGRAFMGQLAPRLEQALAEGGPAAGVDAFFSFVCPGLWSAIEEGRKDRYRANAGIGFADLKAPPIDLEPADLAAIDLPVLVLAGTASHPAFGSVARRLAAGLPDARFVELEGSGHVTYAERPDAFARAVAAFATEIAGQAGLGGTRR